MVDITHNLCTKQRNVGLKSAVYNQERVITARVGYLVKGEQIETRFQKRFGPIVFGSFLRNRIFVIPRFRGVSKVREPFINDVAIFLNYSRNFRSVYEIL